MPLAARFPQYTIMPLAAESINMRPLWGRSLQLPDPGGVTCLLAIFGPGGTISPLYHYAPGGMISTIYHYAPGGMISTIYHYAPGGGIYKHATPLGSIFTIA
jgi:hypothetical protein